MCFPISESRSRRRGDRGDPEFYNLLFIYLIFLAYGGTSGQDKRISGNTVCRKKIGYSRTDFAAQIRSRNPCQCKKFLGISTDQKVSQNFIAPFWRKNIETRCIREYPNFLESYWIRNSETGNEYRDERETRGIREYPNFMDAYSMKDSLCVKEYRDKRETRRIHEYPNCLDQY